MGRYVRLYDEVKSIVRVSWVEYKFFEDLIFPEKKGEIGAFPQTIDLKSALRTLLAVAYQDTSLWNIKHKGNLEKNFESYPWLSFYRFVK